MKVFPIPNNVNEINIIKNELKYPRKNTARLVIKNPKITEYFLLKASAIDPVGISNKNVATLNEAKRIEIWKKVNPKPKKYIITKGKTNPDSDIMK